MAIRYYNIDNKQYPSVTSVIGAKPNPSLEKWRQTMGEDVADFESKRCAKRGEETHSIIENYIRGTPHTIFNLLPNALFNNMKRYIDSIGDIDMLEDVVYSHKLKLAGRVDCIADYNGLLSVIDFKTSNKKQWQPKTTHLIQCTAYAMCFEEMTGKEVKQLVIITASEEGTYNCFIKEKSKKYTTLLSEYIEYFYNNYGENNEQINE